MKLLKYKKPYFIYIGVMALLLLQFVLFKGSKAVMGIEAGIAGVYHAVSSAVFSVLRLSAAEILYSLFFIIIAIALPITAYKLIRYGKKRIGSAVNLALLLCCAGLTVAVLLTQLWGVFYYTKSFEEQSGLTARPVSADELYAATSYFVQRLNETAKRVERNADTLVCSESIGGAMEKSKMLYRPLEKAYPFLKGREHRAKPMAYSRFFSALGFTGYFFPFTAESNINVDTPPALVPSTIAHEIAHVRGIAPEQTANFVAVRACEESGDAFYEYSGWLLGYIHLSNALYNADYEGWQELSARLPKEVLADLNANNIYWKQFESPVQEAADKAYSSFLQSYDQTLGSKSYGACVDLLCAYYGKN